MPGRRHVAVFAAAMAAAAALAAGCGFQLQRPPRLALQSLYLAGFDTRSPMAGELRRQLLGTPGLKLTDSPAEAEAVLQALDDARDQLVAGATATGQVRELTLRSRLRFVVRSATGTELVAETQLEQSRSMSTTETTALAKEQEAALLFRSMEKDIAAQVVRRLATLPRPGA